jgi:transposase
MAQFASVAGVDVGKDRLEAYAFPAGTRLSVANDAAGHAELAAWCRNEEIGVIAAEASGGYEREALLHLAAAGLRTRRLNPLRVRRFAEARGYLAKNDRADAEIIAAFAAAVPERHTSLPADPNRERLREHLLLRSQTLEAIAAAENQLEQLRDKALQAMLRTRLAGLRRSLAALDRRIAAVVHGAPDLAELATRLRSVPGVGPVLVHTLLGLLPELGRVDRRAIAALVGVAPFDDDSGRRNGARHIRAGRAAVRKVLYMAALVAKRCNPIIRAFAERRLGKPPKSIITACMHKLLTILNAIARDRTEWKHAA